MQHGINRCRFSAVSLVQKQECSNFFAFVSMHSLLSAETNIVYLTKKVCCGMIRVLDEETINKIAAGEVVEKPLNVVKELVENAIDAGSTMVSVEIKGGGIDYIRVTDNGKGIPKDEVKTAFLRHATSKISSDEDLHYLRTLGFRGEALASIAAVSKLEMCTKTEDDIVGVRIVIEGGEIKEFEQVGAPNGTTIVVRNLFYNVPPRKKFLHSPQAEGAAIAETMQHMALSMPGLSFKLVINNQLKFMTNGNGNLKEVIYRIYGKSTSDELIPILIDEGGVRIEGYLGRPSIARSNRNDENYYINSRYIKSKEISKGIEEGYKAFLMMHRFPFCVLHFNMDTTALDVNIHPNKMQVRMEHPELIVRLLAEEVHEALLEKDLIPGIKLTEETETKEKIKTPEPYEQKRILSEKEKEVSVYSDTVVLEGETKAEDVKDIANSVETGNCVNADTSNNKNIVSIESNEKAKEDHFVEKNVFFDDAKKPSDDVISKSGEGSEGGLISRKTDSKNESEADRNVVSNSNIKTQQSNQIDSALALNPAISNVRVEKPEQYSMFTPEFFAQENKEEFEVIGQVFDTYWLITLGDKLFFMDQHAAHEKVKYEEFMRKFREGKLESQNLLPPCVITLKPAEYVVFDKNREAFDSLSFEIEDFGQDTIAVRAMPTDLFGYSCKELFMDVLEELSTTYSTKSLTTVEERIATRACKAAIKGNTVLSKESAKKLIEMLFTLENPYQCPHGRPTLISMSEYEIEKKFKRIV